MKKLISLSIAVLAGDVSKAAGDKDSGTAKARLDDIKGRCGECHTKIRDKK